MIDSVKPFAGHAGIPVVPDTCGHGQQALCASYQHSTCGPATVAFKIQPTLEGLIDRLDSLPDPTEVPVTGALILAVRTQRPQPHRSGQLREIFACKTAVR